jgi:transcriptional regulator with XRE-family HTH domain
MKDDASDLNQRIARRVRELRAERRFSLDGLASKASVSRSMISLIERGESSPTAVVLDKLAAGLGVPLASLFDGPTGGGKDAGGPVSRREEQVEWEDPASGYRRRNVSPPGVPQPMQIVEVSFPAGRRVSFENAAREIRISQQVWMLEGAMEVTAGKECYRLRAGDCLAMQLDGPTMFYNSTRRAARYAVVTVSELAVRKR